MPPLLYATLDIGTIPRVKMLDQTLHPGSMLYGILDAGQGTGYLCTTGRWALIAGQDTRYLFVNIGRWMPDAAQGAQQSVLDIYYATQVTGHCTERRLDTTGWTLNIRQDARC